MKIKAFTAATLATVLLFTSSIYARSTNSINKTKTVKNNEAITDLYLKIEPKDEVTTGSTIILQFTNARVPNQSVIDGKATSNDTGYKKGGYQYSAYSWDTSEGFYDVMPNVSTNELPYRIVRTGSREIEVYLINVPSKYADGYLTDINGNGKSPCYRINLPIIADGEGEIGCRIDSNGTSISGDRISGATIYQKTTTTSSTSTSSSSSSTSSSSSSSSTSTSSSADDDTSTSASSTSTSTTESTKESKNSVSIQIGSDTMLVNDTEVAIDAPAYIQESSSSTLVPMRAISVALSGGDAKAADKSSIVTWDAENKIATVSYNSKTIEFTAGSDYMRIDGKRQKMSNDVSAEIYNGRMCVPFRALAEALGAEVKWDAETKTATFTEK